MGVLSLRAVRAANKPGLVGRVHVEFKSAEENIKPSLMISDEEIVGVASAPSEGGDFRQVCASPSSTIETTSPRWSLSFLSFSQQCPVFDWRGGMTSERNIEDGAVFAVLLLSRFSLYLQMRLRKSQPDGRDPDRLLLPSVWREFLRPLSQPFGHHRYCPPLTP